MGIIPDIGGFVIEPARAVDFDYASDKASKTAQEERKKKMLPKKERKKKKIKQINKIRKT
jgi:hypothetical protein